MSTYERGVSMSSDVGDHSSGPPKGRSEDVCVWCGGTGRYSGSMIERSYSGPCLMCDNETSPSENL